MWALIFPIRHYGASVVVLSLALLIAGCSGYAFKQGLPTDFVVESDSFKGIVLVTVGARPDPYLGWHAWSYYEFRSTEDPKLLGNVKSGNKHSFGFTPGCDDDGLPDECGHLFAFVLPVGEYEFTRIIPSLADSQYDTFNPGYYDTQMEGYRFLVRSGEVAYLGNLLSRICAGVYHSSTNRVFSAIGDVADLYDRDVPLFVKKFPQLKTVVIRNESMTGSPWIWRYKDGIDYTPAVSGTGPINCSLDPHSIKNYLRNTEK